MNEWNARALSCMNQFRQIGDIRYACVCADKIHDNFYERIEEQADGRTNTRPARSCNWPYTTYYTYLLFGFNFYVHLIWLLIQILVPVAEQQKAFTIQCTWYTFSRLEEIRLRFSFTEISVLFFFFCFCSLSLPMWPPPSQHRTKILSAAHFHFDFNRVLLFINFGPSPNNIQDK